MFRQDLCPRSLSEVSARLLKSLEGIFAQALYKSSFGKIFVRDLLLRSLDKISIRALCTRSLGKLCIRDLLVKISAQDLLDHPHEHCAATRAMWQAQSDERVARAMSKFAPCHSESDLTRPKWREGSTGDLTRAMLYGNLQENAGRVARGQRFARACAVEMHMDISQEPCCMEIYRKMPDASPGASVFRELAQSKCTWTFHKSHFVWKFTVKMPDASPGASVLREPAQSKCTWAFHKSHVVWKFAGKCRTRQPGPAFCASLRGRDAHGHFTSHLYGYHLD